MTAAIYKVVHVGEDGRYSSIWAGHPSSLFHKLSYTTGHLTDAGHREFVRCWVTEELAITHADDKARLGIWKPSAVLEVYPVGSASEKDETCNRDGAIKVQIVYVVREVWREAAPEPVETWVDVTKDCTLDWMTQGSHRLVQVSHQDRIVLVIGVEGHGLTESDIVRDNYKLDLGWKSHCGHWFNILHKETK